MECVSVVSGRMKILDDCDAIGCIPQPEGRRLPKLRTAAPQTGVRRFRRLPMRSHPRAADGWQAPAQEDAH